VERADGTCLQYERGDDLKYRSLQVMALAPLATAGRSAVALRRGHAILDNAAGVVSRATLVLAIANEILAVASGSRFSRSTLRAVAGAGASSSAGASTGTWAGTAASSPRSNNRSNDGTNNWANNRTD